MMSSSSIGGYLPLETIKGGTQPYHLEGAVNSGRNALHLILKNNKSIKKIFLPSYICKEVPKTIKSQNIEIEFYDIKKEDLTFNIINEPDSIQLCVNYFGIMDLHINEIEKQNSKIIIDNTQAFFHKPKKTTPAFYSTRKFFGVPDGGYVINTPINTETLDFDNSESRNTHLLLRSNGNVEKGYSYYKENEAVIAALPPKKMSHTTERTMKEINYERIAQIRRYNFNLIHNTLKESNKLNIKLNQNTVPMIYPYVTENGKIIRQHLIKNKIYIPKFWPEIDNTNCDLQDRLVALPIDQNLYESDIIRILETVEKYA